MTKGGGPLVHGPTNINPGVGRPWSALNVVIGLFSSLAVNMPDFARFSKSQPRQHEADQCDGVFKLIETHLQDQPRSQPTNRRLRCLTRIPSLRFKIPASLASQISNRIGYVQYNATNLQSTREASTSSERLRNEMAERLRNKISIKKVKWM